MWCIDEWIIVCWWRCNITISFHLLSALVDGYKVKRHKKPLINNISCNFDIHTLNDDITSSYSNGEASNRTIEMKQCICTKFFRFFFSVHTKKNSYNFYACHPIQSAALCTLFQITYLVDLSRSLFSHHHLTLEWDFFRTDQNHNSYKFYQKFRSSLNFCPITFPIHPLLASHVQIPKVSSSPYTEKKQRKNTKSLMPTERNI